MGIEPTARFWRATGFEDQGGHQTPIASSVITPSWASTRRSATRRVNRIASRCSSNGTLNLRDMPSASPASFTSKPGSRSSGARRLAGGVDRVGVEEQVALLHPVAWCGSRRPRAPAGPAGVWRVGRGPASRRRAGSARPRAGSAACRSASAASASRLQRSRAACQTRISPRSCRRHAGAGEPQRGLVQHRARRRRAAGGRVASRDRPSAWGCKQPGQPGAHASSASGITACPARSSDAGLPASSAAARAGRYPGDAGQAGEADPGLPARSTSSRTSRRGGGGQGTQPGKHAGCAAALADRVRVQHAAAGDGKRGGGQAQDERLARRHGDGHGAVQLGQRRVAGLQLVAVQQAQAGVHLLRAEQQAQPRARRAAPARPPPRAPAPTARRTARAAPAGQRRAARHSRQLGAAQVDRHALAGRGRRAPAARAPASRARAPSSPDGKATKSPPAAMPPRRSVPVTTVPCPARLNARSIGR